MDPTTRWETVYDAEIKTAESARQRGNEGMARVCARRAAGIIAGEYLSRLENREISRNAYKNLKQLSLTPSISEDVREVVFHFLERITPENQLPSQADLVEEAKWLKYKLLDSGTAQK